jgi:hypothetical protein
LFLDQGALTLAVSVWPCGSTHDTLPKLLNAFVTFSVLEGTSL